MLWSNNQHLVARIQQLQSDKSSLKDPQWGTVVLKASHLSLQRRSCENTSCHHCVTTSPPTDVSFQLQQTVEEVNLWAGKILIMQHSSSPALCVWVVRAKLRFFVFSSLLFSYGCQRSTCLSLHLKCGSERNVKMTDLETQLRLCSCSRGLSQLQDAITNTTNWRLNSPAHPAEDIHTKGGLRDR